MEGAKGIIKRLHQCGRAGKAKEAELYLKTMHALYWSGKEDLKPDVRHFNSVMNAWAKSRERGREFKTQEILDWMSYVHTTTDENWNVKPTRVTYNICINTWCESRELNAVDNALKLFNQMLSLYEAGDSEIKPDCQIFRLV